jgi:hypothetical protein
VSELLQVVDVVLVGFNIETEIHAGKLVKLAHIYVIAKVVSSEVSLFLAVLLDSFQELIKLLLALKDINLFRFDVIGLSFFQILSGKASVFSKVSQCFSLKSLLLFNLHHTFLKLLTKVEIPIIALGAALRVVLHGILLLGLLIQRSRTEGHGCLWDKIKLLEDAMNTISAGRAHAKPVLDLVLVNNHGALHGCSLSGEPVANLLEIPSSGVLICWLHNDPPNMIKTVKVTRICDF